MEGKGALGSTGKYFTVNKPFVRVGVAVRYAAASAWFLRGSTAFVHSVARRREPLLVERRAAAVDPNTGTRLNEGQDSYDALLLHG
jgi:hypothetical protein